MEVVSTGVDGYRRLGMHVFHPFSRPMQPLIRNAVQIWDWILSLLPRTPLPYATRAWDVAVVPFVVSRPISMTYDG
jgi:hypothetical protein